MAIELLRTFDGPATAMLWARFGTFVIDFKGGDPDKLQGQLAFQIGKDSRVTGAKRPPKTSFWDTEDAFYPIEVDNDEALLSGADQVTAVKFGLPIVFGVHVPAKNQPVINGEPAVVDSYNVAWDGWTAVVTWERTADEDFPPVAAGQVVTDILRDALRALGHDLLVQACSPWCQHLFGHTNMRVSVWDSTDWESDWGIRPELGDQLEVRLQGDYSDADRVPIEILRQIEMPAGAFARMKNTARRILNLELSSRQRPAILLHSDYLALRRADVGFWKTIGHGIQDGWALVRGRGRGRPVKRIIAELWLQMAAIESLQHDFAQAKRDYNDAIQEVATRGLFDGDLKDDEAGVETLSVDFAKAAIENKSARMDNRGVVVATLVAAVIGSGIGAAVGGLFT